MIKVLAGGDSFIFGAEMPDCTWQQASKLTIPSLLSNSIGVDYHCCAKIGNSNSAIVRQIMNDCEQYKDQKLAVFVMWTFRNRHEFMFNHAIDGVEYPWYSISPWRISTGLVKDFSNTFYKHVGSNTTYEVYQSLKEIVLLQQYLKTNNIPYMFTHADDSFKPHSTNTNISVKTLYNQVDWDQWFIFPDQSKQSDIASNNFYQTTLPNGFYKWAVNNQYPIGEKNHPLTQAHVDAAKLMQEKFNEIFKKFV